MTPAFTFLLAMALLFCGTLGYVIGYMRGLMHGSGAMLSAIDAEIVAWRARDSVTLR